MFKKFRFNFISGITKQDFFLIKFGHCKCQKKHVLANFFLKDGKKKKINSRTHSLFLNDTGNFYEIS